MLSRTADHLFWMARYSERAENTARMLDVNYQMTLLSDNSFDNSSLQGALNFAEYEDLFYEIHEEASHENILSFMVGNTKNPSSIARCLYSSRENARAVRGSITSESWLSINSMWIEAKHRLIRKSYLDDPQGFFDWLKQHLHTNRGVHYGTMPRGEAMDFIHLGTFIERSHNIAMILKSRFTAQGIKNINDFKHGNTGDFYLWTSLLRSVSGLEIYRQEYSDIITPKRIAELLILKSHMPRSLAFSLGNTAEVLRSVQNDLSAETLRLANKLNADIQYTTIEEILEIGLDEFLENAIEKIENLGTHISNTFLIPFNY